MDTGMKLRELSHRLKLEIPAIAYALKDERTPKAAKVMAAITVAYALSPVDLIPDFIPVLGYLDDLVLLPLLAAATLKLIPDDIMSECRKRAENTDRAGEKKWYFAIPIVLLWLALAAFIITELIH